MTTRNYLSLVLGVLRHARHGRGTTQEYIKNWRSIWEINEPAYESKGSSLSDDGHYTKLIESAISDKQVFERFRSNSAYLAILDHVSFFQGEQYMDIVGKDEIALLANKDWFKSFSQIGSPLTYSYDNINFPISPTLLRYVKVAKDLPRLFGDTSKLCIGEIGIGYGGQTLVLHELDYCKKVVWFDLPEVMELANKFLFACGSDLEPEAIDGRNPSANDIELLISNYAFSELNPRIQAQYLENVVLPTARGYVTWNTLSQKLLGGISIEEFSKLLPGSEIFPENPLTYPGNAIVVWGHNAGTSPF